MRDNSPDQLMYPLAEVPGTGRGNVTPASAKVRGPDEFRKGKHFLVRGKEQEVVTVRINIADAHVEVHAESFSLGKRSWSSVEGWERRRYYLSGSVGECVPMTYDPNSPGSWVYRLEMDYDTDVAVFQVKVDADNAQLIFPQQDQADSGVSFVEGPRALTVDEEPRHWLVKGYPGAVVDICLDMVVQDRRRRLTWKFNQSSEALLG